jgi:hypothetical protein
VLHTLVGVLHSAPLGEESSEKERGKGTGISADSPCSPIKQTVFYQSTNCCVLASNQSGAIASGVKECSSTAIPLVIAYLTVPQVPLPFQLVTVNPSGQALFGQACSVPPTTTRASTIARLRFCSCHGFQPSASYRHSLQFSANFRASASNPFASSGRVFSPRGKQVKPISKFHLGLQLADE